MAFTHCMFIFLLATIAVSSNVNETADVNTTTVFVPDSGNDTLVSEIEYVENVSLSENSTTNNETSELIPSMDEDTTTLAGTTFDTFVDSEAYTGVPESTVNVVLLSTEEPMDIKNTAMLSLPSVLVFILPICIFLLYV